MPSNVSPYSAFRKPGLRDLTDTPQGSGVRAEVPSRESAPFVALSLPSSQILQIAVLG
jgi:hypothetical protein